jgi:hypothetical protein
MDKVLDYVEAEDFIEFSKAIKAELSDKVKGNSYISAKSNEYSQYKSIEQKYKSIGKADNAEPAEPAETLEPAE